MIEFKKITIEAFKDLKPYFSWYQSQVSELIFTNIFAWSEKYHFKYAIIDGFLFILNETGEGKIYFSPPIGDYKNDYIKALEKLRAFCVKREIDCVIKKADEEIKDLLLEGIAGEVEVSYNRDQSDYIYHFKDLLELSGNDYHKKKNRVNKFIKTYNQWSVEAITSENINDCRSFLNQWCEAHDCDHNKGLRYERLAIHEVLDHFEVLECKGIILKIDGQVVGFTLGEALNDDTFVIHFEKGDINYKSVYNMISHQFLKTLNESFSYVNREQDLGIPGLRRSKLSYHPCEIRHKYTLRLL